MASSFLTAYRAKTLPACLSVAGIVRWARRHDLPPLPTQMSSVGSLYNLDPKLACRKIKLLRLNEIPGWHDSCIKLLVGLAARASGVARGVTESVDDKIMFGTAAKFRISALVAGAAMAMGDQLSSSAMAKSCQGAGVTRPPARWAPRQPRPVTLPTRAA